MRHVLHATLGACATAALTLTLGFAALGVSADSAAAQTPSQCKAAYVSCMTTTPVPDYCARSLGTCMGGQPPAATIACSAPYMQCMASAKSMRTCTPAFRACVSK
ncbi:hypothetical protein ACFOGJ_03960 [Marinibaculum pumilum]|uniref:Uncharacterized protein n=1 Tax=Marinibaculum pumilum TaxID=1766165 RepID=A0ABV7KVH4_9PROT